MKDWMRPFALGAVIGFFLAVVIGAPRYMAAVGAFTSFLVMSTIYWVQVVRKR